jgi:hypothetical protein
MQFDSRAEIVFFATACTPAVWPTQHPIERVRGLFPKVKQPALETYQSPPFIADVKK